MFGRNEPRRRESSNVLQVQDIWYTIQGEGPFAGDPAVFIRLTGCNLRCWFCDTAWDDDKDKFYPPWRIAQIAEEQRRASNVTDLAVITGGEPARQDLHELVMDLKARGFRRIQIETAGSFWQPVFNDAQVTKVVSPKMAYVHKNFYNSAQTYWKYVIREGEVSLEDGLPTGNMQRSGASGDTLRGGAPARPPEGATVFLQPCDEQDDVKNAANMAAVAYSCMTFGYKAGLQMHKYLKVD